MKLTKFRVTEFRSVEDSGWIDTGRVTTFVGANESGKTNLMLALWKLNSAGESSIDPVEDMPRQKYYSLIDSPIKPVFVTGCFRLTEEETAAIKKIIGRAADVAYAYIGRDYEDRLCFELSRDEAKQDFADAVFKLAEEAKKELELAPDSGDTTDREPIARAVDKTLAELVAPTQISLEETVKLLEGVLRPIENIRIQTCPSVAKLTAEVFARFDYFAISGNPEVRAYLAGRMPKFVFYAAMSNVDGIFYLPSICANADRKLKGHEAARMRTATKFFEMVGMSPEEMLKLGREILSALTDERRVKDFIELKDRSEDILNAAEARFNRVFNDWYGGCNFRFDFKLDGEYLRVRVSDDVGVEAIELEHRSEWLQWLFSFCLTLMGAGKIERDNVFLLLDEPELALHPLSQIDLRMLIERKSANMQVLFCTHSPFFVDPMHLERVVNIYDDESGYTVSGEDLRVSSRAAQIEANFALSSAVTLGISSALMNGCIPVMCETASDQIYLAAYKNLLASLGELKTRREITLIPCGGLAGVKAILPMLVGKNNFLPAFVAGGDRAALVAEITENVSLFAKHPDRAITVGEESKSRLEDLAPRATFAQVAETYLAEFGYTAAGMGLESGDESVAAILARQLKTRNYTLPSIYREEIAQRVKAELIRYGARLYKECPEKLETVKALFGELVRL